MRCLAILLLVSSVVLSSPAIIRIDGKKNPGSVPEYRVWERVRQRTADFQLTNSC